MGSKLDIGKVWSGKSKAKNEKWPQPWSPLPKVKTSYQIGHQHRFAESDVIEHKPLTSSLALPPDYKAKERHYKTTYSDFNTRHPPNAGPLRKGNKPSTKNLEFLLQEKLKSKPPTEAGPAMSEYKRNFLFIEFITEPHPPTDMSPHAYCKINNIARTAQLKADPELGGLTVLMDPYVSTSHLNHHYMSPEMVDRLNKVHKVAERPKTQKRPEAVDDRSVSNRKSKDRTASGQTMTVPPRAIVSETMSAYGPPVDELCHMRADGGDPVPIWNRLTKGEVMATPAMYQTDNSLYGSGLSARAIL